MKIYRFPFGKYEVLAVSVLLDNFVYLVCHGDDAVLIDAGEARPIFNVLKKERLNLLRLLITHSHRDHVGGCRAILDQLGVQSSSPSVKSGIIPILGTICEAISAPGHTWVHKIYYFPELGILFTGDLLINGACGRVVDGTMSQLYNSLQLIKQLPDETRIFGGHDYLLENMEFSLSVDPKNVYVKQRIEEYHLDRPKALFETLLVEKRTNPFLQVGSLSECSKLRCCKDQF